MLAPRMQAISVDALSSKAFAEDAGTPHERRGHGAPQPFTLAAVSTVPAILQSTGGTLG